MPGNPTRPDLRLEVLRGRPDDEELAALVAVLSALANAPAPQRKAVRGGRAAWDQGRSRYLPPGAWPSHAPRPHTDPISPIRREPR